MHTNILHFTVTLLFIVELRVNKIKTKWTYFRCIRLQLQIQEILKVFSLMSLHHRGKNTHIISSFMSVGQIQSKSIWQVNRRLQNDIQMMITLWSSCKESPSHPHLVGEVVTVDNHWGIQGQQLSCGSDNHLLCECNSNKGQH